MGGRQTAEVKMRAGVGKMGPQCRQTVKRWGEGQQLEEIVAGPKGGAWFLRSEAA